MPVYIGVDGGGTKTRLLIQRDEEDARLVEFDETIRFLEVGYGAAAQRLFTLLRRIDGLKIADMKSISIGLAGAGLESEQRQFEKAISSLLPKGVSIKVQGDAALSLGAAFPDGSGVILIAGTGSVAIGRTETGSIVRVGGWGRLLGDEGSGHVIGLQALKHYARVIDGRDVPGPLYLSLSKTLESKLKTDPIELRSLISRSELVPSEFATHVFDSVGDSRSAEILDAAADDLAELVATCAKLIHHRGDVYVVGSVISNPVMLKMVGDRLTSQGLTITALDSDAPVKHALELAKRA